MYDKPDLYDNSWKHKYDKYQGFINTFGSGAFNYSALDYINFKNTWFNISRANPNDTRYPTFPIVNPTGPQFPAFNSYICIKSYAYGVKKVL